MGCDAVAADTTPQDTGPSSAGRKRPAEEVVPPEDAGDEKRRRDSSGSYTSQHKQAKTAGANPSGYSSGTEEAIDRNLADGEVLSPPKQLPTGTSADERAEKTQRGWNRGIGNELRTSFTLKAQDGTLKTSANQVPRDEMSTSPKSTAEPISTTTAATKAASPSAPAGIQSWILPFPKAANSRGTRLNRFAAWCEDLIDANKDCAWAQDLLDLVLVSKAWSKWLQDQPLSPKQKTDFEIDDDIIRFRERRVRDMVGKALGFTPEECAQIIVRKFYGWELPPLENPAWFKIDRTGVMEREKRFLEWCRALHRTNQIKPGTDKGQPLVRKLKESYALWTKAIPGVSVKEIEKGNRAAAKCLDGYLRSKCELGLEGLLSTPVEELLLTPSGEILEEPLEPSAVEAEISSSDAAAQPSNTITKLARVEKPGERERYFPGIDPLTTFCVICVSYKHTADACPSIHLDAGCNCEEPKPKTRWCGCCVNCTHDQRQCVMRWRTFDPDLVEIRKVREMVPSCYRCGEETHFGMECPGLGSQQVDIKAGGLDAGHGLSPEEDAEVGELDGGDGLDGDALWREDHGPWQTWTTSNLRRYVDPRCRESTIASAFSKGAVADQKEFHTSGLGITAPPRARNVLYEVAADDDDNEPFIQAQRATVRPKGRGDLRFGNISFPDAAGGREDNTRGGGVFPPLPPGPPPPPPRGGHQQPNRSSNRGGKLASRRNGSRR